MKNSEKVKLSVCTDETMIEYIGRCLGLLSSKEYDALVISTELRKKLLNVKTTTIEQINTHDISNSIIGKELRLALSIDSKNEKIITEKILITAPINYISGMVVNTSISFKTEDGSIVELTVIEEK